MQRRDFLRSAGAVAAGLALPRRLGAASTPAGDWRTFRVVTRVEVLDPSGLTRVWVPTALATETPYQRTLGNEFTADGGSAKLVAPPGTDALGNAKHVTRGRRDPRVLHFRDANRAAARNP